MEARSIACRSTGKNRQRQSASSRRFCGIVSVMRIALVGCLDPPQEDSDAPILAAALASRGHAARDVAWDDPSVAWDAFDIVLLRSTWNYHLRLNDFLAWAERVAQVASLRNPLPFVRWNTHKFYLRDLERRGVDIVPTLFSVAGVGLDLEGVFATAGWTSAVIKPAVGADSWGALRIERGDVAAGHHHIETQLRGRDILVQRYLPEVEEPGERCLVFLSGAYSHAVRKRSLFLGGRHAGPEGVPVEASPDEVAAAEGILARVPIAAPPLYARVDLLRDDRGVPCLMELELVEPSLFFEACPGSEIELVRGLEALDRPASP